MSGSRAFFLIFYGICVMVGLFHAAIAQDIGITIFGFGLLAYGVFSGFFTVKMHYDEIDAAAHH